MNSTTVNPIQDILKNTILSLKESVDTKQVHFFQDKLDSLKVQISNAEQRSKGLFSPREFVEATTKEHEAESIINELKSVTSTTSYFDNDAELVDFIKSKEAQLEDFNDTSAYYKYYYQKTLEERKNAIGTFYDDVQLLSSLILPNGEFDNSNLYDNCLHLIYEKEEFTAIRSLVYQYVRFENELLKKSLEESF
jgi:hypothetical protein